MLKKNLIRNLTNKNHFPRAYVINVPVRETATTQSPWSHPPNNTTAVQVSANTALKTESNLR